MDIRRLIVTIMIFAAMLALGAVVVPALAGMNGLQALSYLDAIDNYIATNPDARTFTFDVQHPQFGTRIQTPNLLPFDQVTDFEAVQKADGTFVYQLSVADNELTIDSNDINGETVVVHATKQNGVPVVIGTDTIQVPTMTKGAGLPPIFPSSSPAYLELFIKGFLKFDQSSFQALVDQNAGGLSKESYVDLATALFTPYVVSADGTVTEYTGTLGEDESLVTIFGVTRPNLHVVKTDGKIKNRVVNESSCTVNYVNSIEANPDYIKAILANVVFNSTPDAIATAGGDAEIAFNDLCISVMQVPECLFITPKDTSAFSVNPDTNLPVVRQ